MNALPIGITTQGTREISEMTKRLRINYDILSDCDLKLVKALRLPTFSIDDRIFIKRLTLVADGYKIIKVFYPIFPPDKHVYEVITWLRNN